MGLSAESCSDRGCCSGNVRNVSCLSKFKLAFRCDFAQLHMSALEELLSRTCVQRSAGLWRRSPGGEPSSAADKSISCARLHQCPKTVFHWQARVLCWTCTKDAQSPFSTFYHCVSYSPLFRILPTELTLEQFYHEDFSNWPTSPLQEATPCKFELFFELKNCH